MKSLPRLLLPLLALLCLCFPSRAQEYHGRQLVVPTLVADTTAIAAGKPFTVGVLLKIEPGWHTYWQFGGDSGAPTKIAWELPEGFSAGPIQWPLPVAHPDEGDQLTYVYESEVMLLAEITPPAKLPAGEVSLGAKVRWLVCKETCIPGEGAVALKLPGGEAQPANADLFAKWRAALPKESAPPFQLAWKVDPKSVAIELRGVPADFKAEFFPLPPSDDASPGHPAVSTPASDGTRTITVPYEGDAAGNPWRGLLVTQQAGKPREGWYVDSKSSGSSVAPGASAGASAGASQQVAAPAAPGLLAILWSAFLGGLILNLMPCVLPVIALKIFGFVQQAGEEPRRVFRLGLAFVAGVFTFFLGLAALVSALHVAGRGLTWGFQFQNAYLLAGLIALVFVFALAMFGVFEITLGSGTATTLDKLSHREGYGGAFVHGMFTTLLGTSCTAPLLGPVLGFAFVQPPAVVFLIFAVIAAGMSLPYFLLTWQPAWMRFLPKPGAWMERMKQFMGFVLLGVVIWLLGVLGESRGINAVVAVSSYLLVLGMAGWIFGFARGAMSWLLVAALAVGGWIFLLNGKLTTTAKAAGTKETAAGGIPWQPFTPERLIDAVQRGQPVFIDFTADWCLNCKYNEKFVLQTEPVRAALRDKNVLTLKADWTNGDEQITAMLKKFGRVGVPAYVLYPGHGATEPVVLPEILTQTVLLHHLAQVQK